MNQNDIEHLAQGFPPPHIGKDHEEVVIELAGHVLSLQQKLNKANKLAIAFKEAEMVWEKTMMAAIGEDGVGSVSKAIATLKEERDAVLAENVMLKNGIGFFSYGSDSGFEEHDSAEKAIASADSDIDYYRGDACDGWSEETDRTVWGVILQRATMINERPLTEEDSHLGSHISSVCDYALLPNLVTPATDALLNAVRAEGVEMFAKHCDDSIGFIEPEDEDFYTLMEEQARTFAAQLRAETDTTPSQYESLAKDGA